MKGQVALLGIFVASVVSLLGCGGTASPSKSAHGQATEESSHYLYPPYVSEREQEEARYRTPALKRPTVRLISVPGSTYYEGPYRFAQSPLVIVEEASVPHVVSYIVFMKLNRGGPSESELMQVAFDGQRAEIPNEGLINYQPQHCYSAHGSVRVKKVKNIHFYIGRPVVLEVFIAKKHTRYLAGYLPKHERYLLRTTVPAHRELPPISDVLDSQYFRAIACKPY